MRPRENLYIGKLAAGWVLGREWLGRRVSGWVLVVVLVGNGVVEDNEVGEAGA